MFDLNALITANSADMKTQMLIKHKFSGVIVSFKKTTQLDTVRAFLNELYGGINQIGSDLFWSGPKRMRAESHQLLSSGDSLITAPWQNSCSVPSGIRTTSKGLYQLNFSYMPSS